jgi:exopolysaccharide/PEP-CTERM locus tyrosine autokinase
MSMERIKAALERARQEQGRPADAASGLAEAMPHRPHPAQDTGKVEVTYTQTRAVPLAAHLLRERRVLTAQSPEEFSDAYKMLRTQVLQRLRENNWNTLAITSPGTGSGKTLTAINLALSLAAEVNCTVLLVDADLREPGVHQTLGFTAGKGLPDYLLDDAPLSELLVNPQGVERFVILPGGRPLQNSSEMLSSPRMRQLVEELKSRYPERIVLFDLPPLLSAADALAFSPYVDAALLVIEEGGTRQDDLQRAVELLSGTNLIGTVLNKTPLRQPGKKRGLLARLFSGSA